mmetsp:Transcript_120456/g.236766  ORF Transcript_120456/g.236766 Transcript_120456/m.236766 type:complete len:205 (-) Transcript_120456:44-658(-)
MKHQKNLLVLLCVVLVSSVDGFTFRFQASVARPRSRSGLDASRRQFVESIVKAAPAALVLGASVEKANASGGATAGGAYLLSAKQRYNERVKESIRGLLSAEKSLAAGNSQDAKAFFASEDAGSWKDLTTAGYLLSNAFRRNSTAAPDSLPSVKKYKAFAAEVENLQKLLKKKGAEAASAEFPKVEAALDAWLSEVELPPAREL